MKKTMHPGMRQIFDDEIADPGEEGGSYTEIRLDENGDPVLGDEIAPDDDSDRYGTKTYVDREVGAFVATAAVWDALGVSYWDN